MDSNWSMMYIQSSYHDTFTSEIEAQKLKMQRFQQIEKKKWKRCKKGKEKRREKELISLSTDRQDKNIHYHIVYAVAKPHPHNPLTSTLSPDMTPLLFHSASHSASAA
jgi:hypothetical protein